MSTKKRSDLIQASVPVGTLEGPRGAVVTGVAVVDLADGLPVSTGERLEGTVVGAGELGVIVGTIIGIGEGAMTDPLVGRRLGEKEGPSVGALEGGSVSVE